MSVSSEDITKFQNTVWQYYREHKRTMPWRETHDFYAVLVSEMMLQQTQVPRVLTKFNSFMKKFPTMSSLADAPLAEVLVEWQGLGYSRRAKYLHEAAKVIAKQGFPTSQSELIRLPGVGPNTAGAILAYVYNQPVVFIETNIRSVYIHEFYNDNDTVTDDSILEMVAQTIDRSNPREWYWALMDYGTYLKGKKLGSIRKSATYKKQATFKGSLREMRGKILRIINGGPADINTLDDINDPRFETALDGLVADGLVERHESVICLTGHMQES